MRDERVVTALRAGAGLGPFFEVSTDPAEEVDPTWRPLAGLEPGRLDELIKEYGKRLGTGEDRVAASILFQSIAARVWSPVLAAAVQGVVPDLSTLHWRWLPGAPIALWLAEPVAMPCPDGVAVAVLRSAVGEILQPVREVFGSVVKLADGLMWGNAASALAGTLRPAAVRPDLGVPMTSLVRALLELEPLRGTGGFVRPGDFVRRSCCLYYRVPPGGGYCGDCPLAR
jgi:ferric iron reductase protein FhuF